MFGADAAQAAILDYDSQRSESKQQDTFDYLFPKFIHQSPWQQTGQNRDKLLIEDFILIAEFSEQEGPRPVIVIPKDGGQNFDQNEFSVKILAVDHQSSIVEGCEVTEDAQVVMTDPDTDTNAFIHHIVLNDIQARGYVRPFCISYVTSDPLKIMKCYEEISSQMRKVARLMKYGNRLVFMRDLEKHLEDLSYTKAHLLLSQNRNQVSAQGDNDLLNALNTLRQCMEEVKDILSNLRPALQVDTELSERFQFYERELRSKRHKDDVDSDTSSLKEFGSKDDIQYTDNQISGSYSDRSSEFSLFSKVKDQKPKLLDVSTIRGKRRFDRSLRGLHELCSWGAKEGLQRLRAFREFLKRDLASIYVDELDMSALLPESGVLCYSNNTVGANFLSTSGSIKNSCCIKRKVSEVTFHHTGLTSLGSVESFKSLSSSFQSFYDEDTMYSANSSMLETSACAYSFERQISEISSAKESSDAGPDDLIFPNDSSFDSNNFIDTSATDWNSSLLDTLKAGETVLSDDVKTKVEQSTTCDSNLSVNKFKDDSNKPRSDSSVSDYYSIDIDKDLKCNVKGCACDKASRKPLEDTIKASKEQTGAENAVLEPPDLAIKYDECVSGLKTDDCVSGLKTDDCVGGLKTDDCVGGLKTDDCVGGLKTDDCVGGLRKNDEEIRDDNGDITPVMTDSTSTLCDQTSVIKNKDNLDVKTVQPDKLSVDADTEHELSKDASHGIKSMTLKQNLKIQNENDTKTNINQHKVAQPEISSDNGFDIENINDRQTSLDFGSLSDKGSDVEFGDKSEDILHEGFSLDHNKYWYSVCHDAEPGRTAISENLSAMEAKRRKWKFMHPFKNLHEGESSVGHSLQKVLVNYNNMQHIVFSLLSGRPVIVMGTRRQEMVIRELIQAMSMFVPYTHRSSSVSLLCQIKQLKMSDIHKFQLRGAIRSDKRSVDYLVPKSVRRYVTLIDLEKNVVYCQAYQGILLNFITSIHNKKKTFKSEAAILCYIHLCLQEISNKAFSFYHTVTSSNEQIDFIGASLPHKNSMLELTFEKYLNRAGIHNSDCRIVKYLTEIVKLQQIEEEFRSKYLTDAPAYPFSVTHQQIQTYRL